MPKPNRLINGSGRLVQFALLEAGFKETKNQSLAPGEAYPISSDTPEQYLARDAHSKRPLVLKKTDQPEGSLIITNENLSSQDDGISVQLQIYNDTNAAIEICRLEGMGQEEHYGASTVAKLPPNAVITIDARAQNIYAARIYTSGTYIRTFITHDQPSQIFNVKLRPGCSHVSTNLLFENQSTLDLVLQWVDFDGSLRRSTKLEPGHLIQQDTFLSHFWVLRDLHSGFLLDASVGSHQSKKWAFTGSGLRSTGGTKATIVEFWNAAAYPVKLIWVDFEGEGTVVETLLPGARRIQPTNAGHVWEMRNAHSNDLIKTFLPSPVKEQLCRIIPRNANLELPPEITFDNNTGLTVELVAKDMEGVERVFATLPHRALHQQPTTTSDRWFIRDQMTGLVFEEVVTSQENFTHLITAQGISSQSMVNEVIAEFVNTTPFQVDISWLDYDGVEEQFYRLNPGQSIIQPTHATHVWRFRERETRDILLLYVAGEEASQRVEIVMKPIHSREPAVLRFRNYTGLTVEVVWFNAEGKPEVLRTLIPGRKAAFNTFASHAWVLRDKWSGTVLKTIVAQPGDRTETVNHSDIRSKRSDRGTQLIFTNNMPFKVDVHWIDYDGAETPHETLRPGERLVKSSYTTQPYRFRHHITKREVGVFLPKDVARQAVNIALMAYEDRTATSVEVRNMTALTVKIFTVDFQGKEQFKYELSPRDGVKVQTFSTHPIIVRDKVSDEAVAFTIAGDKPQLLEVSAEILRSNRTDFPVWINWENTMELPVDLFWVKYDGSEEHMRTLEPKQSFEISTYPTHVWRAKFQKAGTEVDLYIAGIQDKQTRRIGAVPPLRTQEREGGKLWPGEVALYENPNYEGRVWIAHGDLPDFSLLSGFNDNIASLKVAPNTAVSVFEDSYFNALPQDLSLMAREVRTVVEGVFSTRLNTFKSVMVDALANIRQTNAGQQDFIAQVDQIQSIMDMAADNSPRQVGVIMERFVAGFVFQPGEILSNLNLEYGADVFEADLRSVLASRVSTDDRGAFAEAIKQALFETQEAIFFAFSREWVGKLDASIRDVVHQPIEQLGVMLEKAAESAGLRARPLVQQPESDVFHMDAPDLEGTDIGRSAMSSIRVLRNYAPEKLKISSTNKVADDPKVVDKELVYNPVYRTTLSFPPEVTEVQIWGTEEMVISIGGADLKVGPKDDQFVGVKPNAGGILIIQMTPDRIGISPLMIRTNSMPANARVFIFPDADVHRKLVKMDDDAFVNGIPDEKEPGGRRKLKTKLGASSEELTSTQKAVQTLSRTAAASANVNGTGSAADRRLVVGRMDMSAFQLDFGTPEGGADTAFRPIDPAQVHAGAEDAELLGQGFFEWLEDVGEGIEHIAVAAVDLVEEGVDYLEQAAVDTAQWFEDTANTIAEGFEDFGEALEKGFAEIGEAFEDAGEWIEDRFEEGLDFFENVIEEAGEFFEDVGAAIEKAALAVAEGIKQGLQIVVNVAGKVFTVIVDTLEKVGEVVMYVVTQVVEAVEQVIDFICSLFNWGDIIKTQEFIKKSIDRGLDLGLELEQKARTFVEEQMDNARDQVHNLLNDWRTELGIEVRPKEPDSEEDSSGAMDALMWILDKITSAMDLIPKPELPPPNFASGMIIPGEIMKELEGIGEDVGSMLLEGLVSGIDGVSDSFQRFVTGISDGIENPTEMLQLLGGLILDMLEVVIDLALDIAEALAKVVLGIIRVGIKLVRWLIDFPLDIPLVSELYELITGDTLTMKSLATLVVAIPATIIGKLIFGVDEYLSYLNETQKQEFALDMGNGERFLKALYGSCHLIITLTGAIQDGFRIAGPKKKPHTYYTSLKMVEQDALMTGINLCIGIAAGVFSAPYFPSDDKEHKDIYNGLSWASWGTQMALLAPSVVGLGLAGLQMKKGHKKLKNSDVWGSALTALIGIGGVVHLGINIALIIYESKLDHFDKEGVGDETTLKALLGTSYIATTLPSIAEFAFFAKDKRVQGVAAAIRSIAHLLEGSVMLGAVGVANAK